VQWALLLPPLPGQDDRATQNNDTALNQALQQSFADLQSGAFSSAATQLTRLSEQYPDDPTVWRLLALSRLVLNDKPQALAAAQRAVETAPDSTAALITQSYVAQSMFDIPAAMQLAEQALAHAPQDILALVQLARLQFGSDDIERAWQTMERAYRFAPENAEVQNLRGFLLLARLDNDGAITAFQRSIELNPRLGEPHLGLALSYMRRGDQAPALKEMATAVLLQPRQSLLLSYWAKMLYQVKRFDKALQMLQLAKSYDPQDPTPLLYEALIRRDLNQPTAAIQSLNQAIVLNDRRGVYRSRFLLDRDLAVKNIDLSQLYNQLGLSDWAKHKAFASIKQDYTNYSAHLLLAGALAKEEDRAWEQASEALLARLLQPANVNDFSSFNEYTALFEQPALEGNLSIARGNQDTWQGEFQLYGSSPQNHLAFNLGAIHIADDGWRDDNGNRFRGIAGTLKWDVTPSDSLLFTVAHGERRILDEFYPRFEADFPSDPFDQQENRSSRYEIGYRHRFAPRSDLLLYISRVDIRGSQSEHSSRQLFDTPDPTLETFAEADTESPYYQAQGQYTVAAGAHQLTIGTIHYWIDDNIDVVADDFFQQGDDATFLGSGRVDNQLDKRLQSYYIHDTWQMAPAWIVEAALYYDRFDDSNALENIEWELNEINPRLGVVWTATAQDTFRIAAFRYLTPIISARLDPMDVAGVSVVRNGLEGSLAKEIDLVWEHEWPGGFFSANAFYLEKQYARKIRRLDTEPTLETEQGKSKGLELSWNQLLPWPGTGLAARYRYLDSDDDAIYQLASGGSLPSLKRQEHLATLELNYVNPNGFSAAVTQTFRNIDSHAAERPNEDIWLTDVRLGYEFSGKRGAFQLEVQNLFDHQFNWVQDPFASSGQFSAPQPSRQFLATFSINF
jgi:Flp pilus assembly protein TadD